MAKKQNLEQVITCTSTTYNIITYYYNIKTISK